MMLRALRKVTILGLAGLGAYKAWEMLRPKVDFARDKTAQTRDQVEPVLRDATNSVQTASRDAADSVVDASRDVLEVDASRDVLETVSETMSEVGSDADAGTPPIPATPG